MLTYMETKLKGIETIVNGATALMVAKKGEETKKVAESIIKACELVLYLEDLEEAYENRDLAGMRNAATKHGF